MDLNSKQGIKFLRPLFQACILYRGWINVIVQQRSFNPCLILTKLFSKVLPTCTIIWNHNFALMCTTRAQCAPPALLVHVYWPLLTTCSLRNQNNIDQKVEWLLQTAIVSYITTNNSLPWNCMKFYVCLKKYSLIGSYCLIWKLLAMLVPVF